MNIERVAELILKVQRESGEIPWWSGRKTDPWDHVEAAMGLGVGGFPKAAENAYAWMRRTQNADGSFYAAYREGAPADLTRDTNLSSYIAVGGFHHYLLTGDAGFLKTLWPTVKSAVDFALTLQTPGGEIFWAISPAGKIDRMALLTGCSSIYMSIKCALAIAAALDLRMLGWERALGRLGVAIRSKPDNFNRAKSRYSMDWFYPVLCGALAGEPARQRIDRFWQKFVIENQGVRCVSDRPWVTVAETCELALTLAAMGNTDRAETVLSWIQDKTNPDGSFWCGFTCPDMTIWPEEKTTWTNAAALIAADATHHLTPAGRLFSHSFWDGYEFIGRNDMESDCR